LPPNTSATGAHWYWWIDQQMVRLMGSSVSVASSAKRFPAWRLFSAQPVRRRRPVDRLDAMRVVVGVESVLTLQRQPNRAQHHLRAGGTAVVIGVLLMVGDVQVLVHADLRAAGDRLSPPARVV
jgi:hypothetical protein